MTANAILTTTVEELVAATQDKSVTRIVVQRNLDAVPGLVLRPGQSLRGVEGAGGSDGVPSLAFAPGSDGLKLSSDNRVEHVQLMASPEKRAIFNDVSVDTLGVIEIRDVTTIGRVQILAREKVRAGHVEINGLDIIAADARAEKDRPHDYGVSVLQGALTLWNMQPDANVELSANLTGIAVGRIGRPVLGSGVFVGGAGDAGGRLWVQRLETKGVYSNGMIAAGTADQISGGVFAIYGARVDLVLNTGPVITYGTNDMALDNWGTVDQWIAREKIVTLGTSGIGFVNFGLLGELRVEAPIETFGPGARGFNVYTGTVENAEFDRIVTHGDGAVAVQISQPIGRLSVRRGIETFGGTGPSLVKGVVITLSAVALSIKPGGSARLIEITGGLKTHGKGIDPVEQHGSVDEFRVSGGWTPAGGGF